MNKLNTVFRKYGNDYSLVKRIQVAAVFKQDCGDNVIYYEVIRILHYPNGKRMPGSIGDPGEYYPVSSSWGLYGWTLMTLEDAETKFIKVSKEPKVILK